MTTAIVLNIVFAATVFAVVVGLLVRVILSSSGAATPAPADYRAPAREGVELPAGALLA